MGVRLSKKGPVILLVCLAAVALFQGPGGTQDIADRTRGGRPLDRQSASAVFEDGGVRRLSALLKHYRSIGDLESAARIFDELFPPQRAADPVAALKTTVVVTADPAVNRGGDPKAVFAAEGAYPVFISPEHEKNPTADVRPAAGGDWTVISAAEQWAGDRPGDIRIRKSSDQGRTWPETLVIGDGGTLKRPSIRQISEEAIGLAYLKEWDASDGDIYFARIDNDLKTAVEVPVALSLADHLGASLETDYPRYGAPYLYIAYAELEGQDASIKIQVSRDLGETWSRAVGIDRFPWTGEAVLETAIAYDQDRNALHVAYTCSQGLSAGIAVATSGNFGATWSKPRPLAVRDDRTVVRPRIAAGGGAAVVVFERRTGGRDSDVGLAYSSNAGKRWTTGPDLASSAAVERSPDVKATRVDGIPVFMASYVEGSERVVMLAAEGSGPGSWTTGNVVDLARDAVVLGPAVVVPLPGPDGLGSAGTFWTDTAADEDVYFSPEALTLSLATLDVTPPNQDVPYTAGTTAFTVTKSGAGQVVWTAAVTSGETWLSIQSGASGTNAGTITAAFLENPGATARAGSILVTPTDITVPPVSVTVTQAGAPLLGVTPADGLISTGPQGGPFTPAQRDYALQNLGGTAAAWTASATAGWITVSPASGNLDPGGTSTAAVTIASADALAPGTYEGFVTFTNATNGAGTTTRAVSLTVGPPPGTLSVTPAGGFASTGAAGGPFSPASASYVLQNSGSTSIDWTAATTQSWTAISPAAGTLAAGGTATVTVSINATANTLAAGTYSDTVTFTNTTNGRGDTARPVTLTVLPPGTLVVTPAGGLSASGIAGGPFTPSSLVYTLQNTGGAALSWTAARTQAWTSLSRTSGSLAPGATVTVTVSINATANTLAAGTYNDTVTFTNTSNGTGNTTRPVSLTVSPTPGALAVTPAGGLVSTGLVGGPFAPSSQAYTLQNTGGAAINWTAGTTQSWTTLSAASGALAPGATATVTVSINEGANALAEGTYNDTVTFTNTTNGAGNTSRAVALSVGPQPGALGVTPPGGFVSTGLTGGPFTPASQVYTLQNMGGTEISWTAVKAQAWTSLSAAAGILASGATATVTVSINATANTLAAGIYNDTVTFTNTTNGLGNTTRGVSLTVSARPGALTVTPTGGLISAGLVGGPFTPASRAYTLRNSGGTALTWTASKTQAWTDLSGTSGTLAAGATATVTVSINATANTLSAGTYNDTVAFTNTTNGTGNTTRPVILTVGTGPSLSVTPDSREVGYLSGATTFAVTNAGGGTLTWTAAVVAGGEWLAISSGASGTDTGTIGVAYAANRTAGARSGTIRVTAAGAAGSPQDVTVTQTAGSVGLTLGVERLVEKAWIIQREYAKLTIRVSNSAAIAVAKYVIYRSDGAGPFQALQEVAGLDTDGSAWTAVDTFLQSETRYTYRVSAADALGNVISVSNDITI